MKKIYFIVQFLILILIMNSCISDISQTVTNPDMHVIDGWYDENSCWVTGNGSPDRRTPNSMLRQVAASENAKADAKMLILEFLVKTYFKQNSVEYDYDTVKNAFSRAYSNLIDNGQITHEKCFSDEDCRVIFVITKKNLKKEIMSGTAMKSLPK